MGGIGGVGVRLVSLDEALSTRFQDSQFCLTERGKLGPRPKEVESRARGLRSSHCPLISSCPKQGSMR